MRRVREIVLEHHEREVLEVTPVDAHILMMYSRIRSLLEGSCVLLREGLPQEAMFLGRAMFTDSLQLMEIVSGEANRAALVLELVSKTLTEWEDLERQAVNLGESDEPDLRVLDYVAQRRKQIAGYQRRHGIGPFKKLDDEKQLARKHGRLSEYIDFAFSHRMVHRADMAQSGRIIEMDNEVLGMHLRNPDDNFLAGVFGFVMTSALHAHKAVAQIFAWTETEPQEIDRMLADIRHPLSDSQ